MFRSVQIVAGATGALMLSTAAFAQKPDLGTAAEAKAMLERAVAELKIDEAAAIAKFNSGEAGFKDRDLYVFCFDMTTLKFTAAIKALMGTDLKALREKDGSPLGEKILNATKPGTIATVSYNFPRPGTTEPVPKETYVTQVGNQGCAVGYYK